MVAVAVNYREIVDHMTADKGLGLRRFELDKDEWAVLKEMMSVLQVSLLFRFRGAALALFGFDLAGNASHAVA